jgi:hypothetical protein
MKMLATWPVNKLPYATLHCSDYYRIRSLSHSIGSEPLLADLEAVRELVSSALANPMHHLANDSGLNCDAIQVRVFCQVTVPIVASVASLLQLSSSYGCVTRRRAPQNRYMSL